MVFCALIRCAWVLNLSFSYFVFLEMLRSLLFCSMQTIRFGHITVDSPAAIKHNERASINLIYRFSQYSGDPKMKIILHLLTLAEKLHKMCSLRSLLYNDVLTTFYQLIAEAHIVVAPLERSHNAIWILRAMKCTSYHSFEGETKWVPFLRGGKWIKVIKDDKSMSVIYAMGYCHIRS